MGDKRKYLLLDGHSLAYRAFFALPSTMTTSAGQPTNAVYGFTSMLLKVLDEERPDAVIVAFDGPRAELRRTREFPAYKAHRPTMPDELRSQMEMIEHLLGHMRIPVLRAEGYEADDVLATLASRVAEAGDQAVIVTGDRDTLQLVGEGVKVLMTGKGITETVSYDRAAVEERYGLSPEKLPEMAGLKGDSSDNIPGVPGIGEKGACALIREYGSLEGVYDNLDKVTGAKRKASLQENREAAFLSRDLSRLEKDVSIDLEVGGVALDDWDRGRVLEYLSALEFRTLAARFVEMFGEGLPTSEKGHGGEVPYSLVWASDVAGVEAFVVEARSSGAVAAAGECGGTGFCDASLAHLALATDSHVLVAGPDEEPGWSAAAELLRAPEVELWTHDGKLLLESLRLLGVSPAPPSFDTAVAAYLENPSLGEYRLEDIWERNLGGSIAIEGAGDEGPGGDQPLLIDDSTGRGLGAADAAARVHHLKRVLEEKLHALGMRPLFEHVEMPLLSVLEEMEETGVALDAAALERMSAEAAAELERLERDIIELAGREFNIGSTRQLAQVLFEELGIPPAKKTKTGYSTDSSVLESLKGDWPIAAKVIEYREYSKLKSTYFDVLPTLVCPRTGRVHCSFNQTATATGRISSSNPNLQNIPVRSEVGRRIRSAFVPGADDWKMVVADYSQIELRVLAHMSADPLLIEAFEKDADIHRETAAEIFRVPAAEVSGEMRRMAKVVNFGIVYGMGYYGLSSRLGISMEEATRYIDTYFDTYAGVREYRGRCIEEAKSRGYAETLFGRRRFIPELASGNRQVREFGERLAVNTPLQGTAADIIKKAMVDAAASLRYAGLSSRMTLQIHDELIFDGPPMELEELTGIVERCMRQAADLLVPLKVDMGVFDDWGQAKQ